MNMTDTTKKLAEAFKRADAVLIGAGEELTSAAGFEFGGETFKKLFGDFYLHYGLDDMRTGGFYPFLTPEEFWAFWARYIKYLRYGYPKKSTYLRLLRLVKGKEHFIITTNKDGMFVKTGFDKNRLFCTQGDLGFLQCSLPCCGKLYSNEKIINAMCRRQKNMRVPQELVPICPECGRPMTLNVRGDATFVEDAKRREAKRRYYEFLMENEGKNVLYLELGAADRNDMTTSFIKLALGNKNGIYANISGIEMGVPREIEGRSVTIKGDIHGVLGDLCAALKK